MVQVHAELEVSVASCRDVEISLNLVAVDAPVYSARVGIATNSWCFGKLPPSRSRHAQIIMYILILRAKQLILVVGCLQLVGVWLPAPMCPHARVLLQQVTGPYPVTRRVLHVDVEV
jgi:hypothetical protein